MKVKELTKLFGHRYQIVEENYYIRPRRYEIKILFDTEWYFELEEKEYDKLYAEYQNKEIEEIVPQKIDNELGIRIYLLKENVTL